VIFEQDFTPFKGQLFIRFKSEPAISGQIWLNLLGYKVSREARPFRRNGGLA